MRIEGYKCKHCGKVHSARSWNRVTDKYCGGTGRITRVEEATKIFDGFFVCPNCGRTNDFRDLVKDFIGKKPTEKGKESPKPIPVESGVTKFVDFNGLFDADSFYDSIFD